MADESKYDKWFAQRRVLTDDERLEFIATRPLRQAKYPPKDRKPVSDDKPSANVDAGSLVSFVSGVSGQAREDTLNSTLLAQLAADVKFKRESDTRDWYDYYKWVLGNIFWTIQSFSFETFGSGTKTFKMDEVIIKVLESLLTDNEKALLEATIQSLKALADDDRRVTIFNQESVKSTKGNFQAAVAKDDKNDVVLRIGAFYFTTNTEVTRLLWAEFTSSETSLYKGTQEMVLNRASSGYPQVRDQIVKKLGTRAKQFVDDLDIGG
ncbi:hypothetical protein ACH4PU_34150 [Streptomyces sp. NPDC021100]|uniref:hypothetical protein n=1 Tax=Streptomyces sp. NPDC021100 TaxID=3365114 RepID=UPI0037B86F56